MLESSQNDMSGPDIGGFMVSEHGVFSLRKIAKSKNLSRRFYRKSSQEQRPEAAWRSSNSGDRCVSYGALKTWLEPVC